MTLRNERTAMVATTIQHDGKSVRVTSERYTWVWTGADDQFVLRDSQQRTVTTGPLQPAIVVKHTEGAEPEHWTLGTPTLVHAGDERVTVRYEGVNGSARVEVTSRFDGAGWWLQPISYETDAAEDVISLMWFAEPTATTPQPGLHSTYFVVPGMSMSAGVSPLVLDETKLNLTVPLGSGALHGPGLQQQWGLPAHFYCGFHRNGQRNGMRSLTEGRSDAFCLGLAELPNGDFLLRIKGGHASPMVNLRSDLWSHVRGPGTLSLGATLLLTIAPTYYEAIRAYYHTMLNQGIIEPKTAGSDRKNAVVLAPQFNTWGAQVARGLAPDDFDEKHLHQIYDEYRASGMQAKMFVVDAKWEGDYGTFEHSAERFPNFEATLQRIRDDGHFIGLWAAFIRCDDPAALGLTTDHMLKGPDGKRLQLDGVTWDPDVLSDQAPLRLDGRFWDFSPEDEEGGKDRWSYYLFDLSQPEVQRALSEAARRFVRRYQPDLVKFDFGYELPPMNTAAPKDRTWAGERQLKKGLEVIIGAMKEENPDLVVMYYGLSPLMIDHYDLHSIDDLCFSMGDYDLEANRRITFCSLCGELGIPTYGSSGYDWESATSIWFDSAAAGTIGSLHSFVGDEIESSPQPEQIAKYNGLTHAIRPTSRFSIEHLDANHVAAARGATSSSWARIEDGKIALVALREQRIDGRRGSRGYPGIASTDTTVVVASKDDQSIDESAELAVVPFGDGELRLPRADGNDLVAAVTEFTSGGGQHVRQIELTDGEFRIPLRELSDDGRPVEWVQITIGPNGADH